MGISDKTHYWTSRTNLSGPTVPNGSNNTAWSLVAGDNGDGVANNNNWRVSSGSGGQTWKVNASTDNTLVASFVYVAKPDTDEVVMKIDNGTHKAEVKIASSNSQIKLVGATTATKSDLDLDVSEDRSVPVLLRLTLDSNGVAKLYFDEIIEDDDANTHYISVNGASSSSAGIYWGNTTGTLDWEIVYATTQGAYSPDEMDISDFVTTSFIRTGLSVVETLKSSKRFHIKNHVSPSAIIYGYDLSSNMVSRVSVPSIHVVLTNATSPQFNTLSGANTEQDYTIDLYVTSRGTDYRNAYRLGLSIIGECFDELYTKTGLEGGVDSLTGYNLVFDTKMDDDEIVCIHHLNLTYMKRVNMTRREI
tara:strand:- start:10837 stop:11922 length:1086 start_codon:yes stop_codon:yes gene_type:complete